MNMKSKLSNIGSMGAAANAMKADKGRKVLEVHHSKCFISPQARIIEHAQEDIIRLAAAFKEGKQESPCITYEVNAEGLYEIYHGEGRFKAAQLADCNLLIIPSKGKAPKNGEVSANKFIAQAKDNLDRSDFTPFDVANTIKIATENNIAKGDLALEFGRSAQYISRHANLIDSPEFILNVYKEDILRDAENLSKLRLIYDRKPELAQTLVDNRTLSRGVIQDTLNQLKAFEKGDKVTSIFCEGLTHGAIVEVQLLEVKNGFKSGYVLKIPMATGGTLEDCSYSLLDNEPFETFEQAKSDIFGDLRCNLMDNQKKSLPSFHEKAIAWVEHELKLDSCLTEATNDQLGTEEDQLNFPQTEINNLQGANDDSKTPTNTTSKRSDDNLNDSKGTNETPKSEVQRSGQQQEEKISSPFKVIGVMLVDGKPDDIAELLPQHATDEGNVMVKLKSGLSMEIPADEFQLTNVIYENITLKAKA